MRERRTTKRLNRRGSPWLPAHHAHVRKAQQRGARAPEAPGLGMVGKHTTYKKVNDWGMVYGIAVPTLYCIYKYIYIYIVIIIITIIIINYICIHHRLQEQLPVVLFLLQEMTMKTKTHEAYVRHAARLDALGSARGQPVKNTTVADEKRPPSLSPEVLALINKNHDWLVVYLPL